MIDLTQFKNPNSGEKTNFESLQYGTKDGSINFGYLLPANINCDSSSSTVGVHLQGYHSLHYASFVKDGPMWGSTINRSPGPYQIICGTDHTGSSDKKTGTGFFLIAENGDVIIRAPNGRVRISGLDVDIKAEGPDSTRGSINIEANQSVNINAASVSVKASLGIKMFTPRSIDMIANTSMNLVSNFTKGLTSASELRPSKTDSRTTLEYKLKQDYI